MKKGTVTSTLTSLSRVSARSIATLSLIFTPETLMNKQLQTAVRVATLFVASTGLAFASDNMGPGIGAGLAVGLAALGGGFGQGKTASAALEGMARNPQAAGNLQTPMVLGLVFTETLTLFSFAIAYLLTAK